MGLIAWVRVFVGSLLRRRRLAEVDAIDALAAELDAIERPPWQKGAEGEAADVQDHHDGPARGVDPLASVTVDGRGAASHPETRVIRRAVDGQTCWTISGPDEGFAVHAALAKAWRSRLRVFEWGGASFDVDGSGRGCTALYNSFMRIDVHKSHAVLWMSALAAEVEGVGAWWAREVPRALELLMGIVLDGQECPQCAAPLDGYDTAELAKRCQWSPEGECPGCGGAGTVNPALTAIERGEATGEQLDALDAELAGLVKQRRIETAVDVVGADLAAWAERASQEFISKSDVRTVAKSGRVHAIDAGTRQSPWSLSVYLRQAREAVSRQASRVALHMAWREVWLWCPVCEEEPGREDGHRRHIAGSEDVETCDLGHELIRRGGWDGEEVVRIEDRRRGKALRLQRADGETIDATRPTAALREEVLDALVEDGMSRVWRVDHDSPACQRERDRPPCPKWSKIRASASGREPGAPRARYTMAKALAVHAGLLEHHIGGALGSLAHVEALSRGDGSGQAALEAVGERLGSPRWAEKVAEARAYQRQVLESIREQASNEH